MIDIREQFPLPREETRRIAAAMGVKHLLEPKDGNDIVMTTDFLITMRRGFDTWLAARSVKPASELDRRRVLENAQNCNLSDSPRTISLHKVDLRTIDLINIRPRRGKAEDWDYIDLLLVNPFDEVAKQLILERPPFRVTLMRNELNLALRQLTNHQ